MDAVECMALKPVFKQSHINYVTFLHPIFKPYQNFVIYYFIYALCIILFCSLLTSQMFSATLTQSLNLFSTNIGRPML